MGPWTHKYDEDTGHEVVAVHYKNGTKFVYRVYELPSGFYIARVGKENSRKPTIIGAHYANTHEAMAACERNALIGA